MDENCPFPASGVLSTEKLNNQHNWKSVTTVKLLTGNHATLNSYFISGSHNKAYMSLNRGPRGDKKCCIAWKSCELVVALVVLNPQLNEPWGPKILSITIGYKFCNSVMEIRSNKTVSSAHLFWIGLLSAWLIRCCKDT